VARDPTPTQVGATSRIGGSIAAYVPYGAVDATSAWGFNAGSAPPGTSTLTVVARGFTFVRGYCYSFGGEAWATAGLQVTVEEFELIERPAGHAGHLIDEPDPGIAHPEIGSPTAMLRNFILKRKIFGPWVWVIWQNTELIGLQYFESDAELDAPGLFTPITPGNFYRVWIEASQGALSVANGDAVSNIAYDFGPVFFGFT
jgi:hypothetical protein